MPATTIVGVPTGTWSVDPTHSSVEFRVKHLGISTVRGTFREFEGTLEISDDSSGTKAFGKVQAGSIDTQEQGRDEHLRGADFFDVEHNPEITFESTAIEPIDGDTFEVTGDLTMHGVTKPLTLVVETSSTEQDPWGNERVGLEAIGHLDRSEWGMKFNQALGSGNMMVSDKVTIALDVSAVKQA